MSEEGSSVQLGNCHKHFPTLPVLLADFESNLKGIQKSDKGSNVYYTNKYQGIVVYSYGDKFVLFLTDLVN